MALKFINIKKALGGLPRGVLTGSLLVAIGLSSHYFVNYGHDCAVLNPLRHQAHKTATHHKKAAKNHKHEHEHDHASCRICQSFEKITFSAPAGLPVFITPIYVPENRLTFPHPIFRTTRVLRTGLARAPPV